jgi:hypothetical protein
MWFNSFSRPTTSSGKILWSKTCSSLDGANTAPWNLKPEEGSGGYSEPLFSRECCRSPIGPPPFARLWQPSEKKKVQIKIKKIHGTKKGCQKKNSKYYCTKNFDFFCRTPAALYILLLNTSRTWCCILNFFFNLLLLNQVLWMNQRVKVVSIYHKTRQ